MENRCKSSLYRLVLLCSVLAGCQTSITPPSLPSGINSNSPDAFPTYSADGNYLAFASDRRGHRDVFLYDLRSKQLVGLPKLNHRNSSQDNPVLSADGRYVVYVSTERGKKDIFLYDRQTQKRELLSANIKGSADNPTINGDGTKVAFQASQLGQWKIVLVER